MFGLFFRLGIHHILSLGAYDHILFVTLLTISYKPRQWKIVLALVTAFTLGHTASLAIATLSDVSIPSSWIEWLIVLTILVTGLENLLDRETEGPVFSPKYWLRYALALLFGMVHGLGFASYLQGLLGKEGDLVIPLLSFNFGVEFGQWVVVGLITGITVLVIRFIPIKTRTWTLLVSGVGIAISLVLLVLRFPFNSIS